MQPYALYRIEAALDGWQPLVLNGMQVFDAQQTVARLNLLPAGAAPASAISRTGEVETDIVTIPPHTLFAGNGGSGHHGEGGSGRGQEDCGTGRHGWD